MGGVDGERVEDSDSDAVLIVLVGQVILLTQSTKQLPSTLNQQQLLNYLPLDARAARKLDSNVAVLMTILKSVANHNNWSGYIYDENLKRANSTYLPTIPFLGVYWHWW